MTEQELILSALLVSILAAPICTFFNAKFAWDEGKWLFCNALVPVYMVYTDRYLHKIGMGLKVPAPDLSNYTPFCWRFIAPFLLHSALFIWGAFFTGYGLFFTYWCAKWLFNYAAGGLL